MKTINLKPEDGDSKKRLDQFLVERLSISRNRAQRAIKDQNVRVDNVINVRASSKVTGEVEILLEEPKRLEAVAENIPLNIVYDDPHLSVINKEAGVVVHPSNGHTSKTIVNGILYHIKDLSSIGGKIRPGIVHRLDKETSGLMVVAKSDEIHSKLSSYFKERKIEKRYLAIVGGKLKVRNGRIETTIGRDSKNRKRMAANVVNGKVAITEYRVLDEKENFSLVELRLLTGRTHQIRVHMAHIGNPIVGDSTYGGSKMASRQMLHSYYLKFIHPSKGIDVKFKGDLPEDFKNLMDKLSLLNSVE